jgi:hypothetical protein
MEPSSAIGLTPILKYRDPKGVVEPSRNKPPMTPGWIRRGAFEAQQCRYLAVTQGTQLCECSCRVELLEQSKVARAILDWINRLEPRAWRQPSIELEASLAAWGATTNADAAISIRKSRVPRGSDRNRNGNARDHFTPIIVAIR